MKGEWGSYHFKVWLRMDCIIISSWKLFFFSCSNLIRFLCDTSVVHFFLGGNGLCSISWLLWRAIITDKARWRNGGAIFYWTAHSFWRWGKKGFLILPEEEKEPLIDRLVPPQIQYGTLHVRHVYRCWGGIWWQSPRCRTSSRRVIDQCWNSTVIKMSSHDGPPLGRWLVNWPPPSI